LIEITENLGQDNVLEHIGVIARVKAVAVTEQSILRNN
jgi:hypothetical protein